MGPLEWLLLVVIAATAAPYILGPLRVHARTRMAARPAFEPFDPARHPVPADVSEQVRRCVAALTQAGFTVVAELFKQEATRMRVVVLTATEQDPVALVYGAFSRNALVKACTVVFASRFAGGRSLTVSDGGQPHVFAAVPGRVKERFADVRDPARLLRIHRALLARRYAGARAEPADYRGDAAGVLAQATVREMSEQVDTGYLRLDQAAAAYRPTWKGAFLMTWKLVSPIRELRLRLEARRARRLLRELGIEERDANPIDRVARRAPLQLHWIVLVAALGLLLARPAWLARGGSSGSAASVTVPTDVAVPADFPGAVRALERLAGTTATPLVLRDSLGAPRRTAGVAVALAPRRAAALVAAAQERFLARGFYLFRLVQKFGIRDVPDTVALYPSGDRYAILRLVGTNGANYGIGSDSIVAWLQGLQRDQPFVLTGIGFDWVEGRFTTPVTDADGLARRFYAFCPDVVDQGTGTVAARARELRRSAQLYCWWD